MTNGQQMMEDAYLPLRDVVFETLRREILTGRRKPGERLMEIALANELGVSRTPIREAIRKLELEGLVVMVPRKGAQVASITKKDLDDVLEVRRGLEVLAGGFACMRILPEQLEQLEAAAHRFAALMEASADVTSLAQADMDFHQVIYEAADNRRLSQILNTLKEQMLRYRVEYLKDDTVRSSLVQEHEEILQALKNHDRDAADHWICRHIDNQQEAIQKSIPQDG